MIYASIEKFLFLNLMLKDVGMAVPKTTETSVGMAVCRQDMIYKDYTSNPIPTSSLYLI